MNRILNRMEYMDHHYEHHFVTNSDNIDHVKAKLDKREHDSEERIDDLELLVKKVRYVTFIVLFYFVLFCFVLFCFVLF